MNLLLAAACLLQGVALTPLPTTYNAGGAGFLSGWSVSAGDLNGDGFDDVVFGSPGATAALPGGGTAILAGRVLAYSGKNGSVLVDLFGDVAQIQLGSAVAVVPDIDGDALPDLLIGAWGSGHALGPLPFAEVVSSKTGAVLRTYKGAHPFERFGESVACAGDVDLDGQVDFLVGGGGSTNAYPGIVRMFSGATSDPTATVLWSRTGNPNDNLGNSSCALGDVNDDGIPDVAVGAPGVDLPIQPEAGAAYVLRGESGAIHKFLPGLPGFFNFGASMARMGSVDKDPINDLVIGASGGVASPLGSRGFAMIASPKSGKKIRTIFNFVPQTSIGFSVTGVGDVTGDGIDDVAVGCYGTSVTAPSSFAFVFSGATGILVGTAQSPLEDGLATTQMSAFGNVDIDHDGTKDLVAGAWGATSGAIASSGEVRVYSLGSLHGLGNKGKLKAKILLSRPPLAPDADASGSVSLEVNGINQLLNVDLSKLADPSLMQLFVFVEDGQESGVFVSVLELTKSSPTGKWKGKLTDPTGYPPALKASSIVDLGGRKVEIRDAMGAVYLEGLIPQVTDLNSLALKLPMLPPPAAPLPAATGQLELSIKPSTGSQAVKITTKGLSKDATYGVFFEEPPGSGLFTQVSTLTKGKYAVDTKSGATLPLGLLNLLDLEGRAVEVRDGATAVLRVAIP